MLEMGRRSLDTVADFIGGLESAPARGLPGGTQFAAALREPAPEEGADFEDLLRTFSQASRYAFETAGPGFLAYIPGGGLFASAIADLLACGFNRFTNMAHAAPALVQLEANVLQWFADLFRLPAGSAGILTSGGSMANFSAVVAAREARLGESFADGVIYTSTEAHHSVAKAARLAGFPASAVREISVDERLRMRVHELSTEVAADRAAGRRPCMVVATGGTTNTGAVDPLTELGALCRREGLWLHVDAAYGGFFQLTQRGATALSGVEGADSITLDPHKGLFLPYGVGCLLVRDGEALRRAHRGGASYMQDVSLPGEIPSFGELSPELSRDYRGLRVWLPLKLYGFGAFTRALDEKLDLARLADSVLSATPGVEAPWRPELSTVAFRVEGGDERNRRLLERINESGKIFLSSTMLGGRFFIRISGLGVRTHRRHVDAALDVITTAMGEF
jgi:aromatic-L-amino-acid decarboxylase